MGTPTQPWRIAFCLAPLGNAATEPRQLRSTPSSPPGHKHSPADLPAEPPAPSLQEEESEISTSPRGHPRAHLAGNGPALNHRVWPHITRESEEGPSSAPIPANHTTSSAQPNICGSGLSDLKPLVCVQDLGIANGRCFQIWERNMDSYLDTRSFPGGFLVSYRWGECSGPTSPGSGETEPVWSGPGTRPH